MLLLICFAWQDFREPLYLTDTTTQLEDVRSAEERKYPQLFRHKLKGTGFSACTWTALHTLQVKLVDVQKQAYSKFV